MSRTVVPLVLALFTAVTGSRAANAQVPLPLDLEWRAPPECYTAGMVRDELARIAHVRPGRVPARLHARARIQKIASRYRLTLITEHEGRTGQRELSSGDCRALGREVTLVLALAFGEGVELVEPDSAITKGAEEAPTGPTGSSATDADATAAKPARKEPASKSTSRSPSKLSSAPSTDRASVERSVDSRPTDARLALFASGGALWNAFPALAMRAAFGAEFGRPQLWVAPRIVLVPSVVDTLDRGVEAQYDALGAAVSGCAAIPLASLSLGACGSAGAAALRGRSTGATESGSAIAPWYTAGAIVFVGLPTVGQFTFRLEGSLEVSLSRPEFVVEGLGRAHRVPRLVPGLSLTAVFRP